MEKLNAINEIENMEVKQIFSIGQDFVNQKLIYGIKFNDKNYVISSEKEFMRLSEATEKMGLIPKYDEVEMSKISAKTIKDFVENETTDYLTPKELYLKIKQQLCNHIYFEDNRIYDVLTLWIILSYCYTMFDYIPYLHLKGDKGVGKSTLLTILKNTCFNATMWSSLTEAVIFRYIDVSNATLLIDEAEDLKNPRNKNLNGILNAGFNKQGTVPRTKMAKNVEKVVHYNSFSMKALAGINDIPNVLKDRCINIQMAKKPKNIRMKKYIDTSKEITNINDIIIQNLYFFALTYCKEIYNLYENMDVILPECLSARDTDIYLPLFCIAKLVDGFSENNDIQTILFEYSEDMSKMRNQEDIEENLSYKLIIDLYEMIKENKVIPYKDKYFQNDKLYNYLSEKGDYYFNSSTGLTKALNTLGIKHTRISNELGKKTYYIITLEQLNKLLDSYNITLPNIIEGKDIEELDNGNPFNY